MMATVTFKTPPFCGRKAQSVTISSPSGLSDKPFRGLSATELKRHLAGAIYELNGDNALSRPDSAREIASVLQPIVSAYHVEAIKVKTFADNLQRPERMKRNQVEMLLDALNREDDTNTEHGHPTHSTNYVWHAIREAQRARNQTSSIMRDALTDLIQGDYLTQNELEALADRTVEMLNSRKIPCNPVDIRPGVVLSYLRGNPDISTSRRNRASVFDGESYSTLKVSYSTHEGNMDALSAETF